MERIEITETDRSTSPLKITFGSESCDLVRQRDGYYEAAFPSCVIWLNELGAYTTRIFWNVDPSQILMKPAKWSTFGAFDCDATLSDGTEYGFKAVVRGCKGLIVTDDGKKPFAASRREGHKFLATIKTRSRISPYLMTGVFARILIGYEYGTAAG
jgi:hypothetical protein